MRETLVFQIVDVLAQRVVTSYLAPSMDFAKRQFKDFCEKSAEGSSEVTDFVLCMVGTVQMFEVYDEEYVNDVPHYVYGDCK